MHQPELSFGAGADPITQLSPEIIEGEGLLVLTAHPDDEVVGAGAHIPLWRRARFAQVTDGAPRDMADASELGFTTREEYAAARAAELNCALALAGIPGGHSKGLLFVDQESALSLVELVGACLELVRSLSPKAILTHPYEGGHPDHDSTAFAAHTACRLLRQTDGVSPRLVEMTSYHNHRGSMRTRHFLRDKGERCVACRLTEAQAALKQRMLDCFATQRKVLQWFPVDCERFREAPDYDFLQSPHEGALYYELFNWGMNGRTWRSQAREALQVVAQRHDTAPTAQNAIVGGLIAEP